MPSPAVRAVVTKDRWRPGVRNAIPESDSQDLIVGSSISRWREASVSVPLSGRWTVDEGRPDLLADVRMSGGGCASGTILRCDDLGFT